MDTISRPPMSSSELASIGNGSLAYVRKIEVATAAQLIGGDIQVPPDAELYCLYTAAGAPISISANYEAAIGSALEHELVAASVH